jgi:hypothetical protein
MLTLEEEHELMEVAREAIGLADKCVQAIMEGRRKRMPTNGWEVTINLSEIWGRITQAHNAIVHVNRSTGPLTEEQIQVLKRIARRGTQGLRGDQGLPWELYETLQGHGFILSKRINVRRKQYRRLVTKYTITGRGKKYLKEHA